MSEIFYWILNMSITGTILGFLIYFIRYIKVIPRFSVYALWGLVLIRLSIPFSISSRFSFMNLLSEKMFKSVVIPDMDVQLFVSNYIQAANSYYPIEYSNNLWFRFINISTYVWLIITITLLILAAIMYILNIKEIKDSTYLYENIYENKNLSVPMVTGIIHPRIILPVDVNPDSLKYILAHEKIHIKRHDNVFRMVAILIACVHWFNPFVWLFLSCFLNDLEIACDAGVIKNMKEEDRERYALTLLNYNYNKPTLFVSTFGGNKLKTRIEMIITYKKLTIISSLFFIIFFTGMTFIVLTNSGK
jgi:beta-lactamase regulating signal transducer with metallopeptidase domain